MTKTRKIAFYSALGLLVLVLISFCIVSFYYRGIIISYFWSPDPDSNFEKNIVVVEMNSGESLTLASKLPGRFAETHAKANIKLIRYEDVTIEVMDKLAPHAVLLGGNWTDRSTYDMSEMEGLFEFLRATDIPVIGFCGGMQFTGNAYGSKAPLMGHKERGKINVKLMLYCPMG